jgi:ribosome-binding factor A
LDAAGLERVREGLDHASGYFRRAISRRLRMKVAPAVTFAVDQVFEQAARAEKILAEASAADAASAASAASIPSTEDAPEVDDDDGEGEGDGADGDEPLDR